MSDSVQPSRDPANSSGDIPGALNEILAKFVASEVDDMLPAKIVAYDRDKNRATIQPLIALIKTDRSHMSRNQLVDIPVLNIGGGGCILSFNMVPGDLGWIKASDRDIKKFLDSYSEATPNTKRTHDFSDSLFIPDVMTGYTINAEDEANAVFQTLDGTVRIALWPDKIKCTAPFILMDTPLTQFTGNVVIDMSLLTQMNSTTMLTKTVAGPTILGPIVTSNLQDIGINHAHPQGPDSDGNAEQDTGPPNT